MPICQPSTSGRQYALPTRDDFRLCAPKCRSRRRRRYLSTATAVTHDHAPLAATLAASLSCLGERLSPDFQILKQEVNGRRLAYLDSAATSQKPRQVLEAMDHYYNFQNSNVHRGVHHLSMLATAAYEDARSTVARFIGASSHREVIFTRNATESINLVAQSWGEANLQTGDEIILSVAEHHANLVPWQMLAKRTGAVLRHAGLNNMQEIDEQEVLSMINSRTKLVSLVHVSNTLGSILPTDAITAAAHKAGARVLLDCCQSVPNMPVDVQALGVDWIVASSHKMCGPTGIGFLWGRGEILADMPPWQGGGDMIQDVFLDHSTYNEPPNRFEAGTPAIAEAIGLAAACDYLSAVGMDVVERYESELAGYLYEQLSQVDGVTIYGPKPSQGRAALCSFNVQGLHANDISTLLDSAGVAVRSGHHCTQPLHRHLGIAASARASLYIYSTMADVDRFVHELREAIQFFRDAGL